MVNKSKIKGTRFETDLVDYLTTQGAPHAERRALAGTLDRGDVTGTPGIVWEAKNCQTMSLAGWVDEMLVECANASTRLGVVVHKRRGQNIRRAYATLQLDQLCILLREAGYLDAAAMPAPGEAA